MHETDAVVKVGETLAIIEIEGEIEQEAVSIIPLEENEDVPSAVTSLEKEIDKLTASHAGVKKVVTSDRFYSPLVRKIASEESIFEEELDKIPGSGLQGRVTKADMLEYLSTRIVESKDENKLKTPVNSGIVPLSLNGEDELIELSRMGKMISDHMVMSKHVSPHVTSFVEADVTNIVNWRNKVKDKFQKQENQSLIGLKI